MARRPWRLILEVGDPAQRDIPQTVISAPVERAPEPPARPTASLDSVWPMIVDARQKFVDAWVAGADQDKITATNNWLGGALATAAVLTGNSAEALMERVKAEVPTPEIANPFEGVAEFNHVERKRPEPPPGFQRPVDPADLTPEEREQLGVIMPEVPDDFLADLGDD